MKKRRSILWVFLFLFLTVTRSTVHAQVPTDAVGVFYVGPEDAIAKALDAASPYIVRVEQPAPDLAQVVVINNAPIDGSTLEYFGTQIREGRMGLVIFCGPNFPTDVDQLNALLGVSAFDVQQIDRPIIVQPSDLIDDLQNTANWRSAPPLEARTLVINPNMLRPVLESADEQPFIQRVRGRTETQVLIVGGWLGQAYNPAWQDWAYYPYFIYRLINDAAEMPRVLSFANYPASPVPHRTARWGVSGLGLGLLVAAIGLYYVSRRHLFLYGDNTPRKVIGARAQDAAKRWRHAGFQRPLSGLLIYLLLGLIALVPFTLFESRFLTALFDEHALVFITWLDVGRWLAPVWLLFDAGIGLAVTRYYAALHIHQPQRAFAYLRFYFWWKLLGSTAQVGVLCLVAIWGLPLGNWAHLTYYLLILAFAQFPGILRVYIVVFMAAQRTDYEQSLRLIDRFGTIAIQTLCIAAFYNQDWFVSLFSAGISTMVILAMGTMLAQWLVFGLGAALAHRLGISWTGLMSPQFDGLVIRRSLSYGLRAVPAALVVSISLAMQSTLIPVTRSLNNTAPLLLLLIGGFDLLTQNFYRDLLPAFAQAYHSNYMALFRYTLSQGIRTALWLGMLLSAWISLPLMMHLGGDLTTVTEMVLPFIVWGALRWLLWLPVTILRGVDRPALGSFFVVLEQAILVTTLYIVPAQSSIAQIGTLYLVSLSVAGILSWVAVYHYVTTPRFYLWQSLIAPMISALIILQIALRVMGYPENPVASLNIVGFSLMSYPVVLFYGFLTALFGGWDNGSLEELQQAMRLSAISYPLIWPLWQVVRIGARISPLHNRFPLSLRSLAEQEADILPLTQDKSKSD